MGIFNKKKVENVISVEGYADDLYEISKNGEMKQTRLFYVIPENREENQETMELCITSTSHYHSFPIFDNLLGKKIRITVDIID